MSSSHQAYPGYELQSLPGGTPVVFDTGTTSLPFLCSSCSEERDASVSRKFTVYLAGGLYTNWQQIVINECDGLPIRFIDPRTFQTGSYDQMSTQERDAIDECDAIFAYIEKSNPYPLGTAFEIGYGRKNGCRIILIDEWNKSVTRWLGGNCNFVDGELARGIKKLKLWVADFEWDN